MADVPGGRFQCLSYAPTTADGHPLMGADYQLPAGLIESDLTALSRLTGCVRTYSSYGVQQDVLPIAAKLGMKVLLGIWIGTDGKQNKAEIEAALSAAARHPDAVRAIVVGNEVLLRREMTGARLAGIIRRVKARTDLPVAYADVFDFWERHPVVAEVVDLMLVHVLPYWDDPAPAPVEEMQTRVRDAVARARFVFPKARIEIGEIGWPSAGRARGQAVPSRVNQARFLREFAAGADGLGIHYNVVEAVDQPWKRVPEGTVGGFWGVLDAARAAKFPLTGPVREWPDWRWAAGFSVAVALLFQLAVAVLARLGRVPRPGMARALGIAIAGGATGTCLWMLGAQVEAMAIGLSGVMWSFYLIVVAAVGGAFLVLRIAGAAADAVPWGAFRWAVLVPAGIAALALAVDGRHRDFLSLAFVLPAVALALAAWARRGVSVERRAEDAWIALLLTVAGPLAVDSLGNVEAVVWAGVCLLLAAPGWAAVPAELGRLRRAFAA